MSSWKVIFAVMVIFGCGVVTGSLLIQQHRPEPVSTPEHPAAAPKNPPAPPWQLQRLDFLKRIEKQLDLTPEQREHIDKIMHDSQERTKVVWDQIAPQMRDELNTVREEIRGELNADQQKKFEQLLKARPKKGDEATAEEKQEKRRRQKALETNQPPAQIAPQTAPSTNL